MANNIPITASSKEQLIEYRRMYDSIVGDREPSAPSSIAYDPSSVLLRHYLTDIIDTDTRIDQPKEEESGFFTKLSNTFNNPALTRYYQDKANLKGSTTRDAFFDFTRTIPLGFINNNVGNILLERKELDELNFLKQYLENLKDLNRSNQILTQAILSGDTDAYNLANEEFNIYKAIDDELRPAYLELNRDQYTKYFRDADIAKRVLKINERIQELNEDISVDQEDMLRWQRLLNKVDSIYKPSKEWELDKQESWLYLIPSGIASSVPSIAASLAAYGAATLTSAAAGKVFGVPGMVTGALIGIGNLAAATILSRNDESLLEVAGKYKSEIFDFLNENNIPINLITDKEARDELTKFTGVDYSKATDEDVLDAMIAYDITSGLDNVDTIMKSAKKGLQDVYNRNMALGIVDLALTAIIIPGVGKSISNLFKSVNPFPLVKEYVGKYLDNTIDWVLQKANVNAANRAATIGGLKYIVPPIAKTTLNGILEGGEETAQSIISSNAKDIDRDWYNPMEGLEMMAENSYAMVKGIAGAMGISGDPALDNNKEHRDQFLVGAAVGMLMGGTANMYKGVRNLNAYNDGVQFARAMAIDNITSKEDVYKYSEYAKLLLWNKNTRQAMLDGIDTLLNDNLIPEGWTVEDVRNEKLNINDIYDIIQNNPVIKALSDEDVYLGVAMIKHQQDLLQKTVNSYNTLISPSFLLDVQQATDRVIADTEGLNESHSILLTNYFLNKYSEQALSLYKKLVEEAMEIYHNPEMEDLFIDISTNLELLHREQSLIDSALKEQGIDGIVSKLYPLGQVKAIKDNFLRELIGKRAVREAKKQYNDISTDAKTLLNAVKKYKQSVIDNNAEDVIQTTPTIEEDNTPSLEKLDTEPIEDTATEQAKPESQIKPIIEDKLGKKDDDDKRGPVPPATPPTPPASSSNEVNQPEPFNLRDLPSYSSDYTDEELNESDFIEEPTLQPESNNNTSTLNPTVDSDNNASDSTDNKLDNTGGFDLRNFTVAGVGEEFDETTETPVSSVKSPQPVDNTVTQESEINATTPDKAVDRVIEGNQDQPNDITVVDDRDLVEGTIYYNFTDDPLLPGYESGNAFNEFSSEPGNINSCTITAFLGEPNSIYGKYNPNDRATWDNAAIYVEFLASDGKKYLGTMKTVEGARQLKLRLGEQLSPQEELNLRQLRNSIIELKLRNPNAIVRFNHVRQTNGIINVNRKQVTENGNTYNAAVNRNLQLIIGLNLPSDLHGLLNGGIAFAYGEGDRNGFTLAIIHNDPVKSHSLRNSINAQTVNGGYGNLFIIPAASSNPSGLQNSAIKLNEKRFSSEDESLADLAAYAVLYSRTRQGYDSAPLRQMLIFTDWEQINPGDPRFELMANKLIKLFKDDNGVQMLLLGTEIRPLAHLQNDLGLLEVKLFIMDNSHWSMDKNALREPMKNLFLSYFLHHYKNMDIKTIPNEIELATGFTITLKDLGLRKVNNWRNPLQTDPNNPGYTVLEWLIKNGKILSDLQDLIYTKPFIYVGQPIINDKLNTTERYLETAANDPVKPLSTSSKQQSIETSKEVDNAIDLLYEGDGLNINDLFRNVGANKISNEKLLRDFKKINTDKATEWLKRTLGLTDELVIVTDGVIRQFANGSAVYGVCNADCINISNMAVEGVLYHEAWHRVSLLMLTPEMRRNLYEEYRKLHPQYRHVSDKLLEEAIADRFMEYMLSDKQSTLRYYLNKIFRDILRFIGINRKINPRNLNSIFQAIKYGDFRKYKLNQESLEEFKLAYIDNAAYYKVGKNNDYQPNHFPTLSDFHTTMNSLKSCLLLANGVKYISDINLLDKGKLLNMLEGLVSSNRTTTQQKEAIQEIVDHFEDWMYEMQPLLNQLGIRSIDQNEDINFAERETTGILNYDKASYEFDKKSNALGVVKLFFSTIPVIYYDYVQTNHGTDKVLKMFKDPITGLPAVYDYDTVATRALNRLSSVENYSDQPGVDPNLSLLGRCAHLYQEDAIFAALYHRLSLVKDSNLETLILQTIKSANLNPIEVGYTTDSKGIGTFQVKDSTIKSTIRRLPVAWSNVFFNTDLVVWNEDGIHADKDKITEIIDQYNELVNDFFKNANENKLTDTDIDIYRNGVTNLLNLIGISIDSEAIEYLLRGNRKINMIKLLSRNNSNDTNSISIIFNDMLKDLTLSKPKRPVLLDAVFTKRRSDHIINILAYAQTMSSPLNNELSVLGPDNNIFYLKTLNNYCSDLTRRLNNRDKSTLDGFNKDLYCNSSLILNTINAGSNIKLNTFINFYGDSTGDKGRQYLQLSLTEDYLTKMALTWNNHIIFPTMADKKTWNTITGCKLFNNPFRINKNDDNTYSLYFDREALDYMYMAWLDEFNTIVQYWKTVDNIPKNKRIKNYHTDNKGGLFRHFTGYYEIVNGERKFIDLNKNIQLAIRDGNVLEVLDRIREDLFISDRIEATERKINNNLFLELLQELDTAYKLGLIDRDSNNPKRLSNKLLDATVFNIVKSWYDSSTDQYIRDNSERFAVLTMLGNHMLNTNVSKLETEKIFTGDLAYYMNTDDLIKRLGAVLSTGDNMRTQWITNDVNLIPEYRRMQSRQSYTCAIFNDNMIVSHQYDEMKKLFTYANIRNLLIEKEGLSESEVDTLMQDQKSAEDKYPFVFELASKLAATDVSAYGLDSNGRGNINLADAAVYIRPQMYRDIVKMLGEWSPEVEEAYNILESGEDWLGDAELYRKSLNTLIKALKTTYFGYRYDEQLLHNIPVFNKMAMFPMFKALATGDNREIYDRMNAVGKYLGLQPIDLIAFESAVKVGIEGGKNFYTDVSNNKINDLTDINTTQLEFRNLRRLLITDPHEHERGLFGTQVSTVAVSNIIPSRVYGEDKPVEQRRTGELIKDQLFGTINAISNKGARLVLELFLTDGQIDWTKTSDILLRAARSSNMGKDIEAALQVNEDKDGFVIPLSALPDSKWVETLLISEANRKAVDLELPGGAFIQMSSFGIKQIGVESSRLLNIRDDGSMDSIISINLFRHVIPDYDNMTFRLAREWLINHNLIGDGAKPIAIGYRIPTQGLSSIAGLHIKDVLPANVGDMIVLPDEFTTQTGSDFDIDKLYIARYNFDKDGNKIEFKGLRDNESFKDYLHRRYTEERGGSFIETDESYDATIKLYNRWLAELGNPANVYEANSREANENLLLDTYMLVLTDRKNITETRLPLDKVTGIIKDEILTIVDGNSVTTDYIPFNEMSPTFQMNKKYEYSGGKVGIGPFALNNKNHVLTQLVNLMFAENDLLKSLGFTGLNGIKSQNERVYERDNNGNIVLDKNGSPIYEDEEGLNILDWISAMINAHVDVAKDPYVIRLNVRQYTYNICNFLLRSGFGKNTFYFLPQNILKEMAVAYERAAGIYGVKSGSKTSIVNEEIGNIIRRYYDNYTKACADSKISPVVDIDEKGKVVLRNKERLENIAPHLMSRDELIDNILNGRKVDKLNSQLKATYYLNQLYYAKLFLELNNLAQDMSKLVLLSQIDTKRYGNNFVELDRFVYRLKSFLSTLSLFKRQDVERYFTDTFLFTKLVNGILMPASIFEDTMLRSKQSFKDSITRVLTLVRRDNVNDESLNKVVSNELEGLLRWLFLSTVDDFNLFDMLYGKNSMAQRLQNIKNDILAGKYPEMRTADGKIANRLLNHLQSLTRFSTDQYNAPAIIGSNRVNETDKFLKLDLKSYWEELLESPHDEIRKFANDLIYYQLATTAGNFTKNGIWNLLPISALTDTGYANFMDNITRNFDETSLNFDNLFLNNWSNSKLVPEISVYRTQFDQELGEEYQTDAFYMAKGDMLIDGVKTRVPIVMRPNRSSVGVNAQKQQIYTPYVKVVVNRKTPEGTLLYRFVGTTFDDKGTVVPLYVITNKKGLNYGGRVVKEYDDYSNSIFSFNNLRSANQSLKNKSVGLLSNGRISQLDIVKVIDQLCDNADDRRYLALTINDSFELVSDYLPSSLALNSLILTLGIDNLDNRNVTEFTQTLNEQGDKINEEHTDDSVFRFKSGFQVQLPFTLNDQQKKALSVLEDFVNNPRKYNNIITLCGYAGTGKSTLIGIFDKYLRSKYLSIKYSAPTHRANAVTKMNNPDANVQTLHSLFGLRPTVDLTDGVYDLRTLKNEQLNKPSLKDGDILIIDESSMIGKALYRFIEEYVKNHNVKIIYVGDDAQLAPVNDDTISPVFTGNLTKVLLTKVERTGDNAILAESTRLRNKLDFSYETRDNVEFTNSTDRANEVIDEIVKSDEFKNNPLYFRILSATNDMISNANDRVRNILYGDNPKQLMVGDIMMGYNNINDPNDKLGGKLISNSIDYVITEVGDRVSNNIRGIKVYGYNITLKEANSDVYALLFVLDINTPTEVLQQLSNVYKDMNTEISNAFKNHEYSKIRILLKDKAIFESQTITMRDFYGNGNRLLLRKSLDYGYAHTIHKSQGGTYNNVLIYADTIERFNDPMIRLQLKYVAMSRAKDNVTVLTNHSTTGIKQEQTATSSSAELLSEHISIKSFSSRKDMLNAMYKNADAFVGEVSKSPYIKKGDKFVLKTDTEVGKLISAISKRGVPKDRINSLLSEEQINYLTEETDATSYYNVGYSSGLPELMAVTNRDLYDEGYEPKTIAYLRDSLRINQPVSELQISIFKNTSTFLIDGNDTMAVNFFKENGYRYIIYNTSGNVEASTDTNSINIWYSSNENADLSNFAIRPFTYLGYDFKSVEQAFLFFKWGYSSNDRDNQIIANNILWETSGSALKRLGNQFKNLDKNAWDANSSRIMKELIKTSFELNDDARQRLLATDNSALTHKQDKGKWGTEFPKLLMEVRNELSKLTQFIQEKLKSSRFDLSQFATMSEEELNSDPNMEQMDRDGNNIKDYCNNK